MKWVFTLGLCQFARVLFFCDTFLVLWGNITPILGGKLLSFRPDSKAGEEQRSTDI